MRLIVLFLGSFSFLPCFAEGGFKLAMSGKEINPDIYLRIAAAKNENEMIEMIRGLGIKVVVVKDLAGRDRRITVDGSPEEIEAAEFYEENQTENSEHVFTPFAGVVDENGRVRLDPNRPFLEHYVMVVSCAATREAILHYVGHYLVGKVHGRKTVQIKGWTISEFHKNKMDLDNIRRQLERALEESKEEVTPKILDLVAQENELYLKSITSLSGEELDVMQVQVLLAERSGVSKEYVSILLSSYSQTVETLREETTVRLETRAKLLKSTKSGPAAIEQLRNWRDRLTLASQFVKEQAKKLNVNLEKKKRIIIIIPDARPNHQERPAPAEASPTVTWRLEGPASLRTVS